MEYLWKCMLLAIDVAVGTFAWFAVVLAFVVCCAVIIALYKRPPTPTPETDSSEPTDDKGLQEPFKVIKGGNKDDGE